MPAIPISQSTSASQATPYTEVKLAGGAVARTPEPNSVEITDILAAGTLVASGILLLAGRRRAAAAVAAAGTACVLLEEKEAVKQWWDRLPGYLTCAQQVVDRVESYIQEVSAQGHRLQDMLRR